MILPAAATLAPYVPHARPEPVPIASGADAPAARSLPWRRILTLALALVEFYVVDTAVTTWAPTYLHHTFASPASLVAVATLPYIVCSLLSRSCGDWPTARLGPAALVAPLSYSVPARLARDAHPEADAASVQAGSDAINARLNQFNYAGALLGAVLTGTGTLGDTSLRYGFAVPMVLVPGLVGLSRAFRPA